MTRKILFICLSLFSLVITACGSADKWPVKVVFDGNGCTVTGPIELPTGEHTTVFIDQTELNAELWLINLDEGKTLQDLLDGQSEPGEWYPKPSWAHYDQRTSIEEEVSDEGRVVRTTWNLEQVGEHNIACYVPVPQRIWLYGPLWVLEAPER